MIPKLNPHQAIQSILISMFPFRKALKQSKYTSAILLSLCFINIYGADTEDRLLSIKSTSTVDYIKYSYYDLTSQMELYV